jgi:choline dehydrogenase
MGQFDYIIVGGGTAGCVLANRLTENPKIRVLLLEAGGEDRGFWLNIPAGFGKLLTNAKFNWRFSTEPETSTNNRPIVVPRGKGLGGSTLINGMLYVRGQAEDLDTWAQLGNRGWSFPDVLPYFKRLENFHTEDDFRGKGGPLNLVELSERPVLAETFITAATNAGYARNPDYNAASQEGFGYYQTNQKNGRRWSASSAYLKPARQRGNLAVFTGAHVTRLLMSGNRVTGVEFIRRGITERFHGRETILSAGAVQSPHILELSGIGDPSVLKKAGIEVLHSLPGVGANYADHFRTRMNWRINQPITLNEQTRGLPLVRAVARYSLTRKGILSLASALAYGFVRTRPELVSPDVQYFFMHASYANAADRVLDYQPGMTVGVTQLRPESVGTIHIKSPDPLLPPKISPNFLASTVDQQALIDGMKLIRKLMNQDPIGRFISFEMSPGPEVQTDEDWLSFTRSNGQTIYHPVGTCRMGNGMDAVVDDRLKVRGIAGLRVVDASVMPTQVSGNTMAAVLMIAEKASELIREDQR